jgi:two-component sensor histidine kinase
VRSGISVTIPGLTSRPFGVFGIHSRDLRAFDETDAEFLLSLANIVAGVARQDAAARHRMLLIREMAHRAGNLLQLVSSIATQTFNAHPDVETAKRSFSERLSALARSTYVISRGGWAQTRFADLLDEALRPFGERIEARGRDVLLPPELCFDLGLVLHELATNSVKYGTLGMAEGKVQASWTSARNPDGSRRFRFVWDDPQTRAARRGDGHRVRLQADRRADRGEVERDRRHRAAAGLPHHARRARRRVTGAPQPSARMRAFCGS